MKIQKLETLRLEEFPNLLWLRVHSDAGIIGLGETHRAAPSVEAYVHEFVAPRVLGQDPLEVERLTRSLTGYLGWRGSGVETRAISALDIALWDHYARVVNQPLYQVLGGASRAAIRTYNTCAGYQYVRDTRGQTSANWGLGGKPGGPYEDLDAFLHRADELAQSLLEEGIGAMKIWPFDTYWHEDPIRMDSLALLKQYAPYSKAPICASEILAGRWSFKDLLETGVAGIVMFDLAWCGGISEGRRIAALADAWQLPVAPHDCTGPVVFLASLHFSIHAPNALVQESVRAFYSGWYQELVTHVPQPARGMFAKPPGPGLGAELLPELWKRKDATVRASSL